MTEPGPELYETVLRQCAAARPQPWYPRPFAEAAGVPRDTLDAALERLRLRGLVHLTEWTPGQGQGYALTADGERVLHDAGLLTRVRAGSLPAAQGQDDGAPRRDRKATPYERGEAVREALLDNTRPPVMTFLLIGANVAVFLVELALTVRKNIPLQDCVLSMDPTILHQTGSVDFLDILHGEWWRLLTSCFVHIGYLHIGVNMYALYNVGPPIERLLGRWRYLLLYLVAGFGGSCVGVIGQFGCAGASGAICGLLGALAAWTFLNRQFLPPPLLASLQRYLVVNTFLIVAISLWGRVSWSGHLGGAAFGLVAAALLNWQRFGSRPVRWLALLAVLALPLVGVAGLRYAEGAVPQLRDLREHVEIGQFNDFLHDQFNPLMSEARGRYAREVVPLLERNPQRRDPAAVARALTALDEGRAKLREAAALLAKAGPYASPRLVHVQQTGAEYVAEWVALYDVSERCLRAGGDWTEKDEQQLQDQDKRVNEATARWSDALNGK